MQKGSATSPFLNRVWEVIRARHCSIRTEQSYLHWVEHYILYSGRRWHQTPRALPVILTRTEVRQVFANLDSTRWLPA